MNLSRNASLAARGERGRGGSFAALSALPVCGEEPCALRRRAAAARHAGRIQRSAGQAMVEALVIGTLLALLLFAPAWGDGDRSIAGVWLRALDVWYGRFAAALALPV